MAQSGLDTFDSTLHETNRYLNEIMDELGWEDRQVAYHALRAVLFTLRDRMTTDLAAHFGAQLPLLVRGVYYESYTPAKQPEKYRTMDEWTTKIQQYFDAGSKNIDAQGASAAVFRMLNQELDGHVLDKVYSSLPEPVRELWPERDLVTA